MFGDIGILDVKLIVTQIIVPVGNNILGNDTAQWQNVCVTGVKECYMIAKGPVIITIIKYTTWQKVAHIENSGTVGRQYR